MKIGQPFIPYRMFNGLLVPEGLARSRLISPGEKLMWGRLARYAGQNGRCNPKMATAGTEIGVGERQAQKHVAELERRRLIRRKNRFDGRAQTSNQFEFLWHELLQGCVNDRSGAGVTNPLGPGWILRLEIGQPFIPYGMFNGLLIPEDLARSRGISPGSKLMWGRLARYAGKNGRCGPTMATVGREIGVGERQAQMYVAELEREGLIRRRQRFDNREQTSNQFEFLWHELFEERVNNRSGGGLKNPSQPRVNDPSGAGVNDPSPKESPVEESQSEEGQLEESPVRKRTDLDYPPANRKKRDFPTDSSAARSSECRKYEKVKEALADYMAGPGEERPYPSDRLVVDVMEASRGAREEEVLRCLSYLRTERGLARGTKKGPRHFAWFITVVGDYFQQKTARQQAADPARYSAVAQPSEGALSELKFNTMTAAFGGEPPDVPNSAPDSHNSGRPKKHPKSRS